MHRHVLVKPAAAPTRALAAWCAGVPRHWSASAIESARRAFVDTFAVMLAGFAEPATVSAGKAAGHWGRGPCPTVGGACLAAPWAALVNGTAAHALDYDDVLEPAMSHPSAALVPAIIALAQTEGASGADCIDAFIVGFEVMARLGAAMNQVHYSRGWHTTLSIGAIGVAAACGRLTRLDSERMTMALSLATSMAGGSKRQFGSMAKPLHAGLAAKNGIVAAHLAEAGVEGIAEPLAGRWGYLDMMAGETAPGLASALDDLGCSLAIERCGIWTKFYPCCASTHRPIDALRAMALQQEDVVSIQAWVSEIAFANLRYRIPTSPDEARFSLPYCLAVALADGTVSVASFMPDAISRRELVPIMEATRLAIDPALKASLAISDVVERGGVEVTLVNGSRRRADVVLPRGHPDLPLSEEELEAKFRSCIAPALAPAECDALYDQLSGLAGLPTIAGLTRPLRHISANHRTGRA